MKTSYDYGLSRIYELVINTDPAHAFLLETNTPVQNKFIVAHVLGHVDFFKHNAYFAPTPRDMLETAGLNAGRIRRYEFEHGQDEVEGLLDRALSLSLHTDPSYHRPERTRPRPGGKREKRPETPYDDLFEPGPPEQEPAESPRFPPRPEPDLLQFLVDFAPDLEDWQRDILSIVRSESMYFRPQL